MAKLSFTLKQALKFRSQRWRRRHVVFCSLFLMFFWLMALGEEGRGFFQGVRLLNVLIFSFVFTASWRRPGRFVTDLDDRAIYEFGRSWDELNEAEQESLRKNNLLGTYRSSSKSEWREMLRLKAIERSWTILQVTLAIVLIVYLTAWGLLPDQPTIAFNPRRLLDPVAWFVGLVSFCIVLPGAVWMWVEPDWEPEPLPELRVATSS